MPLNGCKLFDPQTGVKLGDITLTLSVNINTDVDYAGTVTPDFNKKQNVSFTRNYTLSRVPFNASNLRKNRGFPGTGFSLHPSPSDAVSMDDHTYSVFRTCCNIVPFFCCKDSGFPPEIFWGVEDGILYSAADGGAAQNPGSLGNLSGYWSDTVANNLQIQYVSHPPDDVNDTDDIPFSVTVSLDALPFCSGTTPQTFFFTVTTLGLGSGSGSTSPADFNIASLAGMQGIDHTFDFSQPAPSRSGITVNSWTYEVFIRLRT